MLAMKSASAFALMLALGGVAEIQAQSCAEPANNQFRTDTLIAPGAGTALSVGEYTGGDAAGPVQMAIVPDGRVFIAKMQSGEIRVWKPGNATGEAPVALKIPTYFATEDGLLGIAADPNFATTKWIYAFYADPCGLNCENRAHELARFTVSQAGGKDTLINKKVILRMPRARDNNHHAAGGITFDRSGVLIIGTGDNTTPHDGTNNGYGPLNFSTVPADGQRTSANSNDLRGKILRIKPLAFADDQTPTPGVDQTYGIPAGNLWEKINDPAFNPRWNAAEDDISKVRKEIYSMGHRNPYHPRVDDRSGWIFFGEVGPDANNNSSTRGPRGYEEWNLTLTPGFYGFPYCLGKNLAYNSRTAPATTYGTPYDCDVTGDPSLTPLKNLSPNNTGILNMPKPIKPVFAYSAGDAVGNGSGPGDSRFQSTSNANSQETSVGGPMYRYNAALAPEGGKFPPYYEGKILWFDWGRPNSFKWVALNPNGTLDTTPSVVRPFAPSGLPGASYIDAQFGPEGALYLLKFTNSAYSGKDQSALYRVRYTGDIDNSCYQPFVATVGTPVSLNGERPSLRRTVAPTLSNGIVTLPVGYRTVELFELSGRKVWTYRRHSAEAVEAVKLPAALSKSLLQARLKP